MADEKILDTENVSNFIHDIIDSDLAEGRVKEIHTRFPPEPNGYLHIGSAKAIWINSGTAQKYHGLFNLRFDDTNPVREDDEYVKSIEEDLRWLGAEPTGGIYYGSDYFETCFNCAVQLIKDGKAYVDDLTQEEMAQLVGSSRETVNKALMDFANRGWIAREGRSIIIYQPGMLIRRSRR